jgi:hypothetical protein
MNARRSHSGASSLTSPARCPSSFRDRMTTALADGPEDERIAVLDQMCRWSVRASPLVRKDGTRDR